MAKSNPKIDQRLEQRACLLFEFPNGTIRKLPFFENPIIEESKKANYVKYDVLSRSSSMFSYVNSDARRLTVSFNMTLPHILSYNFKPKADSLIESKQKKIELFFRKFDSSENKSDETTSRYGKAEIFDENFEGNLNIQEQQLISSITANDGEILSTSQESERRKGINIIMYWVNLIRSSVINNSVNPSLGPPIIRVSNGILHQDIPCICEDYKIEIDEVAGYDLRTLLPRVIKVSLNLTENRTGNFNKFTPAKEIYRDNLAGWESVLDDPSHTVDPLKVFTNPSTDGGEFLAK